MKSTDLQAPSTLDRFRYGPSEVQSRPVGKPHPRIAALALLILLLGCVIYISGWRWGSYVFIVGFILQTVLGIMSLRLQNQKEIMRRAAHLSNQCMLPILLCVPIYMWLSAATSSLPHPASESDWSKVVYALCFTFIGLNQTILHRLIARKQANGA
jgi:hypothetical protein